MLGRRPSPDSKEPPSDDSSGVARFLQGLQDYLSARTELLGIESREAARFAGQRAVMVLVVVLAAIFGYALILVGLVSLLAHALAGLLPDALAPHATALSALLVGALHLLLAFLLVRKLRQTPATPLFEATRAEFQKDRQWINDQQSKDESSS